MSDEKIIEFLNQTREVYGDEINIGKKIISKSKNFNKVERWGEIICQKEF